MRPALGFGRPWVAAGFAAVGLLAAAWFSFVELPHALTVVDSADGQVVASVGIGSSLWVDEVRPLAPFVVDLDAGRFQIFGPGDRVTGGDMHRIGNFAAVLALGALAVLASALLAGGKLPGAAIAAGGGVAIALGPAFPELGFPAALPLMLLPVGTAVAAVRIPNRFLQRVFDGFGLAAAGLVVVTALVLMRDPEGVTWSTVWLSPVAIAICLGVVGEALAVRARLRNAPDARGSHGSRLLAAIVPLAARSRLEGADDERSRLAIELHNRVLPQVRSSARAIRTEGSSDDAAQRIEELEAELRGVMQGHETVTLEIGGLSEALRVHLGAVDTSGVRVVFEVRGAGQLRPPAKVELAAYRIGQAAIDNAIRHSGAERINVAVTTGADRVEVIIRDDGVGIDGTAEEQARRRGRIGVAQMRLRAEGTGGSLAIEGRAGQGTEVRFIWPG
jgi:signal transduction histidine kinase